jgi:hypothetical protein
VRGALALALLLAGLVGCAHDAARPPEAPASYHHNLADYRAFQSRHPDVVDPNYLPFMAHLVPIDAPRSRGWGWWSRDEAPPRERLVLCHWSAEDFPLTVHIVPPELDPGLDEFASYEASDFVAAVQRALSIWQRDLEGVVSFREVPSPGEAALVIRLLGEEAPIAKQDIQVLGVARTGSACQVVGGDAATGAVDARFRVPELALYMADQFGLLLPDQVEKVALHEIGHALGMRGHSPIPSDLMFAVARDRISRDGLGAGDLNSFQALYSLPSGTLYVDPSQGGTEGPDGPLPGTARAAPDEEPTLDLAPHVDPRLGFELQLPDGWARMETRYGVIAVDGVAWDYSASFQLNVQRYDRVAEYLERFGAAHLGGSAVVEDGETKVAGLSARRLLLRTRYGTREEFTLLATGDGRVLVAIAEAPAAHYPVYREWFEAILGSLEILREDMPAQQRDYRE